MRKLAIIIPLLLVACTTPHPFTKPTNTPSPNPNPSNSPSPNPNPSNSPSPNPNPSPSQSQQLAPCAETCTCTIHLTWQAPVESAGQPAVTGYNLYWGTTQGGPYDEGQVDAYNNLSVDIPNFCSGNYYFVARSYDAAGDESANSNEANVPVTSQVTANSQNVSAHAEIHVSIPGKIAPPPVTPDEKFCRDSDNLTYDIRRLIKPADQAARTSLSDGTVHATVRILKVSLGDGVPSAAALQFAKALCDGSRGCEFSPHDFPDPAPNVNWQIDVQWTCDHTLQKAPSEISISKNSAGVVPIYCSSSE